MSKGKKIKRISKFKIYLFFISIFLVTLICSNSFLIFKYNVLPTKYLMIYLLCFVIVPLLIIFSFYIKKNKKRKKLKIFLSIIAILYIIFLSFLFYYLNVTFNFLDSFNHKYETRNYYIITLKDSTYETIQDMENLNIGYTEQINSNYNKALNKLGEILVYNKNKFENFELVKENLYDGKIVSILISDSYYEIECEKDENFKNKVKKIYEFSLTQKFEEIKKEVNVTKDTFNIYISGIDSYGSVTSLTRSDVNMVVSINPKTNQILMINIPRDYYVELSNINQKDKLTHAGMYGIETSVGTIEKLLDVEINYYVKVNYSALVNLVDALGGVDVYSKYTFTSGAEYYTFRKGYNHVNGNQALEFVRTRKAFLEGDRVRGENQQAIIQAIIKKASSTDILIRYNNILNSLEGSFATNLSTDKISNLIKMQLDKMPSWNINSISLNGTDSSNYTSLYPYQQLYVMEPIQETIDNAKELLNIVKKGEILTGNIEENINGEIYNPTINKPVREEQKEEIVENQIQEIVPEIDSSINQNIEVGQEDKQPNIKNNDVNNEIVKSDNVTGNNISKVNLETDVKVE